MSSKLIKILAGVVLSGALLASYGFAGHGHGHGGCHGGHYYRRDVPIKHTAEKDVSYQSVQNNSLDYQ